jgi:hypothetical protein
MALLLRLLLLLLLLLLFCSQGANQRWFQDPLGRLRPYHAMGKALDITGANAAQGTPVQLWDALNVNQHKWYL